ncbi:MAG: methyltransferase domain-containing protein [Candidatus Brocadia sp.]|nr:methyltransferase domain-containing protein [Candidatus Brocadia sp.]
MQNNFKNFLYHYTGTVFLILNCIRHKLFGYRTPRPFSIKEIERSINYDFSIVDNWMDTLHCYTKEKNLIKDKVVLELGPGQDLGTGLILLAIGIQKYIALDVNELAHATLFEFYNKLYEQIKNRYANSDIEYLKEQLIKCYNNENSNLSYIVDKNFEFTKIKNKIDIVFSHAAFEHFSDIEKTIKELSSVVKPGGYLIAEIDLHTHTRWIERKDPLNIYRYSDFLWNLFKFKGSPNRIRPFEYKNILENNGWTSIKIAPFAILEEEYFKNVLHSLNHKFRHMDPQEMRLRAIMLMAKKK